MRICRKRQVTVYNSCMGRCYQGAFGAPVGAELLRCVKLLCLSHYANAPHGRILHTPIISIDISFRMRFRGYALVCGISRQRLHLQDNFICICEFYPRRFCTSLLHGASARSFCTELFLRCTQAGCMFPFRIICCRSSRDRVPDCLYKISPRRTAGC